MLRLSGFVLLATLASSSQVTSSTTEIESPDLNLMLQRLEGIQHQDPAQSRPYEVIREYKVLRGYNTRPSSEVMAQINFVPPDTKTYKIIQAKPVSAVVAERAESYECPGTLLICTRFGACPSGWGTYPGCLN